MNDLRDDLDRAGAGAPPSSLDLERLRKRRDRRHSHRRVGAMVVSLVIVVAVAGGIVAVLDQPRTGVDIVTNPAGGSDTFGPPMDVALLDGQYSFARTTAYTYSGDLVDQETTEIWWATDDSGRIDPYGAQGSRVFSLGGFPTHDYRSYFGDLSGLSTDPATLEQQLIDLLRSNGVPGATPLPTPAPGQAYPMTAQVIMAASGLLGPDVAPELRAALIRVLAVQPGITVVRDGTDPVGRQGIELRWRDQNDAWLRRVWFDARTEQPMAWEEADLLPADGNPPTTFISIVERSGVVDSTNSTDLVTSFFAATNDAPRVPE